MQLFIENKMIARDSRSFINLFEKIYQLPHLAMIRSFCVPNQGNNVAKLILIYKNNDSIWLTCSFGSRCCDLPKSPMVWCFFPQNYQYKF